MGYDIDTDSLTNEYYQNYLDYDPATTAAFGYSQSLASDLAGYGTGAPHRGGAGTYGMHHSYHSSQSMHNEHQIGKNLQKIQSANIDPYSVASTLGGSSRGGHHLMQSTTPPPLLLEGGQYHAYRNPLVSTGQATAHDLYQQN